MHWANLLAWHLGLEPETDSSPSDAPVASETPSLSLSRERGAEWFLPISAERLAFFSCTSPLSGCDFPGKVEARAPALHSERHLLEPFLLLRSDTVLLPKPPLVLSTSYVSLSFDHFDSPSCKCLAFCCFTTSFWGQFQHLPRPAERGDWALRRVKYGDQG